MANQGKKSPSAKTGRNDARKCGKAAKKFPRKSPALTGRGKASGNSVKGYGPVAQERREFARSAAGQRLRMQAQIQITAVDDEE